MKPWRVLGWCVALGLGLAVRPAEARGQSREAVRLIWNRDGAATQACPSAEAVQADVSARLGFSPFEGNWQAAAIQVDVLRARAAWQADVSMRGADGALRGSRHVESAAADCRSLASATALAIALMIEPALLTRPAEVLTLEPTSDRPSKSEPAPHIEADTPTGERARHRSEEPDWGKGSLASGLGLGLGLLPRPAFGFSLRGELVLSGPLRLALEAQYFAEQRWSRAGADSAFGMTLGSVGPCYRRSLSAGFSVAGCASLLVGALSLAISAPEPLRAGSRAWLGAALGLRAGYRAGALRLELSAAGFSHFGRRDYVVERLGPSRAELLYAEPRVGLLSSAVVGVAF